MKYLTLPKDLNAVKVFIVSEICECFGGVLVSLQMWRHVYLRHMPSSLSAKLYVTSCK